MSARKKKQLKQEQRRQRNQRAQARREKRRSRTERSSVKSWSSVQPGSGFGGGPFENVSASELRQVKDELLAALIDGDAKAPAQETPNGDASEAEIWWGRYSRSDGSARRQMTREKLDTIVAGDQDHDDYFPDAVFELESQLPSAEYVAFLEELNESWPDVFASSADWHIRSMIIEYLAQGELEKVDRAAMRLAADLKTVTSPFFSLMTVVRLAGRSAAAQALVDAAVNRLECSSLMQWAVEEVLEWAFFGQLQRCIAAGVTDEAIDALHTSARELKFVDDEEARALRRDFALHLAGKSDKQWSRSELTAGNQKALRNIYFLGADYQRWLCAECGFEPVVADEFRRIVTDAIDRMDCSFGSLLAGLDRHKFEAYLAGKLGFMSLDQVTAPAAIIAMKLYFDFLKQLEFLQPKARQKSQDVCDCLWEKLKRAAGDQWRTFEFLEQYLPSVEKAG